MDQNILRYHSKEVLKEALSHDNYTLGVFYKQKLIAFIMLQYYDALNMDRNLLKNTEDCKYSEIYTIYLILVKKEYRGHGLQRKMLELIENNKQNIIINATVSPQNSCSLDNFLACGYKILTEMKMYGGFNRLIVYKPIN